MVDFTGYRGFLFGNRTQEKERVEMKLSEVTRNHIITLPDGRTGYAGDKEYKAETRLVYFRVSGKTEMEALPEDTEVVVVMVPESLIWKHLDNLNDPLYELKARVDRKREARSSLEFDREKAQKDFFQSVELNSQDYEQAKNNASASRQLEIEQHEYARRAEQIELETAAKRCAEDLETKLKRFGVQG